MQPKRNATEVADTLLAVTLSTIASVSAGDWQTAGQLLRRREQLLTQLEVCSNVADAKQKLLEVREAEMRLAQIMEDATREAISLLQVTKDLRNARRAYSQLGNEPKFLEETG